MRSDSRVLEATGETPTAVEREAAEHDPKVEDCARNCTGRTCDGALEMKDVRGGYGDADILHGCR